jgi:hypothetical protein
MGNIVEINGKEYYRIGSLTDRKSTLPNNCRYDRYIEKHLHERLFYIRNKLALQYIRKFDNNPDDAGLFIEGISIEFLG